MPRPRKPPSLLSRILNTPFVDYYSEFLKGGKIVEGGKAFAAGINAARKSDAAKFYYAAKKVHEVAKKAKRRVNLPEQEKVGKVVIVYEESEGIIWIHCPDRNRDALSDALGMYSVRHTVKKIDGKTMVRVYVADALKAEIQQ